MTLSLLNIWLSSEAEPRKRKAVTLVIPYVMLSLCQNRVRLGSQNNRVRLAAGTTVVWTVHGYDLTIPLLSFKCVFKNGDLVKMIRRDKICPKKLHRTFTMTIKNKQNLTLIT